MAMRAQRRTVIDPMYSEDAKIGCLICHFFYKRVHAVSVILNKMQTNFGLIMKQQLTPKIHSKPSVVKSEVTEIDSELKAINRKIGRASCRERVLFEV